MTGTHLTLPDDYGRRLERLKAHVRAAAARAHRVVNTELLHLYWSIGREILDAQERAGWGAKVITQLAADLRAAFPEMTGLSRSNLHYMRAFGEAWPDLEVVPQAVGQLPWGHVRTLLDKIEDGPTRDWYAAEAARGGWSRNVLLNQIMSRLHERIGAAPSNFGGTLSADDSELAHQLAKDPYVFDFLGLANDVAERELEHALMGRLTQTLLELGQGFTFAGRQVHFEVDGDDFYVDLLFFYAVQLRYVVVELKIGKFTPEAAGKLGFYVRLVDDLLRRPQHAPTVGMLLCATRNERVVRYALTGSASPMAVSTYTYDTLPAEARASLPSDADVAAALDTALLNATAGPAPGDP